MSLAVILGLGVLYLFAGMWTLGVVLLGQGDGRGLAAAVRVLSTPQKVLGVVSISTFWAVGLIAMLSLPGSPTSTSTCATALESHGETWCVSTDEFTRAVIAQQALVVTPFGIAATLITLGALALAYNSASTPAAGSD
ncbi:MAG: hypothetical protein AAGC63_12620 [Propionicimonas sp.]|nr:hypothetical protein [Propionicimonas sp.]